MSVAEQPTNNDDVTAAMDKPRYSSHMLLTPANGLTFVRMASTPIMLALIARSRVDVATFSLWFVLCMTDWVDGKLARRYGVSKSGAFLDPLADKFLVLGAMVMLVIEDVYWFVPVLVIAAREFVMSVYRSAVARKGISIPARQSAKFKTLLQQSAVGFALMPWIGTHALWVSLVTLWTAVALTVWTGSLYFADARRRPVSS